MMRGEESRVKQVKGDRTGMTEEVGFARGNKARTKFKVLIRILDLDFDCR
jgi:hypothetical protein